MNNIYITMISFRHSLHTKFLSSSSQSGDIYDHHGLDYFDLLDLRHWRVLCAQISGDVVTSTAWHGMGCGMGMAWRVAPEEWILQEGRIGDESAVHCCLPLRNGTFSTSQWKYQ